MEKLCCFLCKEDDLPSIDVNITCPSTCCVENKITRSLSRKFSSHGRSMGGEVESFVLQQETSDQLRLNRKIEQGQRDSERQSAIVVKETTNIHAAPTS